MREYIKHHLFANSAANAVYMMHHTSQTNLQILGGIRTAHSLNCNSPSWYTFNYKWIEKIHDGFNENQDR